MKKLLLTLLKLLYGKFHVLIKKIESNDSSILNTYSSVVSFKSLSPVDNADPEGEYANALSWALQNRKVADIKNIALTGPYGSGKSSILKTFQSHNTDPDLSFLNISLATFKEETENKNSPKGADLLRLIELSILQQLFYHEEDHKIPDSRFKKIKSFKRKHLWLMSFGVFFMAMATIHLLQKNFFSEMLGYTPSSLVKTILDVIGIAIVIPGFFYLIFKSIRTISSITISKLNIKDAEISISDNISKSILNNHLDEILYFFEVTDYTVVVIEDLDRFEQTEIFTKLRELNLLINYTDKIKRDITFIYAVRDNIFKDKDRTKFFDFIIPVIPVINSSNSNEKLMEIVNKNGYDIKPELIENISLFIDDMRLLYNITNEYYIYHKKLGKLNPDKLMSMMVYKNIYPNDFVDLSNGEGKLYNVFSKKIEFIKEKQKEAEDQIGQLRKEIKELDAMLITDVQELRRIYIYKYIEKLNYITDFVMNENSHSFSEVTTDDIFDFFIKDKVSYNSFIYNRHYNSYNQGVKVVPLKFADIQTEVDTERTYGERMVMIKEWNSDKMNKLKEKIAVLESEQNKIRHYKIRDIIALGGCKLDLENKKQLQLVNILLRNSYIDEDYLDYISIFYEGSITKDDREFLLNVKAQIASEHDYKLVKLDKLVPKIDPVDFTQHYILNYSLFDFLIANPLLKVQRNAVFNLLKNESKTSLDFINGFIDSSEHLGPFVKEMAKVWPNIWHYLSQQSDFSKDRLQVYFKLILQHADVADIKLIAEKSKLKSQISSIPDFLAIGLENEKLKLVIKNLDIKFDQLDLSDGPEELAQFVYNNNHYVLNELMVRTVMNKYGDFDQDDFNNRNFYAINESNCTDLMAYVDRNVETYIDGLYLKLEHNTQENEGLLVDLLNHKTLTLEKKKAVVDKVDTKVIDLENITDSEVAEYLLVESMVVAKWANIIFYYQWAEDSLEESIIGFINVPENATTLSGMKIDTDNPMPDLETVKKFIRALILEESLSDQCYLMILKSVPYQYSSLLFDELSREKVQMLIENFTLGLSVANYDLLRSNFSGLHIMLAEQKHTAFVQSISEYQVEESELFGLLSSTKLTIPEKNTLIAYVDEALVTSSARVAGLVGMLAIANDQLVVSKELVMHILLNRLNVQQRLKLLIIKFEVLTKEEVFSMLSALPQPYSEIVVLRKRPSLDGHQLNWDLVNKLVQHGMIKRATNENGKIRISTFRQ